ncbi:Stp1/IreP family PP2C-type Ser/Thr phosphatase [Weissella tructae]|uniref:Serine/threonine protein phosphatase n=2 Tax=Weissella TaxID=46255 RepID=A0A075TY53_9LACO|nr:MULTISPECIES: Stp1/IreP family PP2C-type Ser/Thr phosphatase [Weissella]AIG65261.1 Serine/threonine protein phosphatase [Weissella tructae]AIM62574.1 Serine/threonine protein phosphatase [Weissella ceti]AIM63910.1 Serine/threonine protein phosphatase [Weissella ceti]ELA07663.1 serine/threonine protein phosphatase [Weissella ceti NC36]QVV91642.1 Stp1/IreP family PP2C-type Ser/Thr phosphatase [Weissella tructae]
MKISYATDIGRVRTNNQDYVGVYMNQFGAQLAIVADGVGGSRGGDVASTMLVSELGQLWQATEFVNASDAHEWISQQTVEVNHHIVEASKQSANLEGMATTMVLAAIFEKSVLIANIGDSRAYLIRQQVLHQITEDHNMAAELLKEGAITEAEVEVHPGRNVITRQLGLDDMVDLDMYGVDLEPDDLLLLTTDGMLKHVPETQIMDVIQQSDDLSASVEQLILDTNAAGGTDNVTVLLGHQESEGA